MFCSLAGGFEPLAIAGAQPLSDLQGVPMPAFWRHTYHLVWATNGRQPLIGERAEDQLHAFLRAKAAELGCTVHAINGMADHVHLVLAIPPQHSVTSIVQRLKGTSSRHMNTSLAPAGDRFRWQEGFGSFTVGERQRDVAVAYVLNQKQHHAEDKTNRWLEECGENE